MLQYFLLLDFSSSITFLSCFEHPFGQATSVVVFLYHHDAFFHFELLFDQGTGFVVFVVFSLFKDLRVEIGNRRWFINDVAVIAVG